MYSIRHRYANYFLKEVVLLAWNFFYPMFPQIRTDRYLVCMLVNYCSITACIPIESQNPFQHSSSPAGILGVYAQQWDCWVVCYGYFKKRFYYPTSLQKYLPAGS